MSQLCSIQSGGLSGDASLEFEKMLFSIAKTTEVTYTVIGEGPDDTPTSIIANTIGLPKPGTFHYGLFCKKVQATRVGTHVNGAQCGLWNVVCTFDSQIEEINPIDLPPEVSWDAETEEIVCTEDVINGALIETTAHEPVILNRQRTIIVLNISRYYENFPPSNIFEYTNTVSSGTFWGAPAKHAKMDKISVAYETIELPDGTTKRYAKVTFTIKFKFISNEAEPWIVWFLNYGTQCINPDTEKIEKAVDDQGRPVEVLLADDGTKLPEGEEPEYLGANIYTLKDFSGLEIDQTDLGF